MRVVITQPCALNGKHWKSGDIVDIDPRDYDINAMIAQGFINEKSPEQVYYHIQAGRAFDQLKSYLDEKGVDYDYKVTGAVASRAILVDVPERLYREVVVPGIIDLCKRLSIKFIPSEFKRYEGDRCLAIDFTWEG